MEIDAPDFPLGQELKILALQGDWGVRPSLGPEGGRFVIDEPGRAHEVVLNFLERVRESSAQMALVAELSIPRETVPQIMSAVREFPRPLVFFGGVEGLTRKEYEPLINLVGSGEPLRQDGSGSYVNCMLSLIKSPSRFAAHIRAKRVASRAENLVGPPMAVGNGPFTIVRLGPGPLTVVPLICAEFVWPEQLWQLLDQEVGWPIDVIPVLQINNDPEARHTSPQLHRAYTQGGRTAHTRFVFVNQACRDGCDGLCCVVVPPTSPSGPAFVHSSDELWHLPGVCTYRGFQIPDRTGCIWSAQITSPAAAASALGTRICSGTVMEVLAPGGAPLRGICAGLMRSVVSELGRAAAPGGASGAYSNTQLALQPDGEAYVLRHLTSERANDVVYRTYCAELPRWDTVTSVVRDLVEVASLMAAAGDDVMLGPVEDWNLSCAGRALAVLYGPNIDRALVAKFAPAQVLGPRSTPAGIVLIGVVTMPTNVDAQRVGDVLRADRVTTSSRDLDGKPVPVADSSVSIRIDDVEFRVLQELRANRNLPSAESARQRIGSLFPRLYAA